MKPLTKRQAMVLIQRHASAKWSVTHDRVENVGNGNSGWRSTYKADGVPMFAILVDNCRSYSRVVRVGGAS